MIKNNLFFGMIFCVLFSFGQEHPVNINKLTEETQQLSQSPDKMQLVWWVPTDFWKAVFEQDNSLPQEQADRMLSQLEKYTMVVTVDGEIADDGEVAYHSEDEIYNAIKVFDDSCNEFKPLQHDEIDLNTQQLINIMKPVLKQMLGNVGENMHFFLFQKKDNPLDKIVDPTSKQTFTVKLDKEKYEWSLPLGSLLKPKKCPVDNKLMDGSWNYCPHHGKVLK